MIHCVSQQKLCALLKTVCGTVVDKILKVVESSSSMRNKENRCVSSGSSQEVMKSPSTDGELRICVCFVFVSGQVSVCVYVCQQITRISSLLSRGVLHKHLISDQTRISWFVYSEVDCTKAAKQRT